MRRWIRIATPLLALTLWTGCAPSEEGEEMAFAAPEGEIPVTTASEEALRHFAMGQEAMDAQRFLEAHRHFEAATQADSAFAYAYVNAANTSSSLEEFKTNLDRAAAHADDADDGVRLLIRIGQMGLENDTEGQLEAAERLTELYPGSPRAWLTLSGVQTGLNRIEEARASAEKAVEIDPAFGPGYEALRNSYLFNDPVDLARAEEYARKVVELTPDESNAHENLGDVLRAQGDLEGARAAYARASELGPEDAVPLLKMGHIDSFLGNYDRARAEYDEAITRAREGEKATFPVYRAFTWVHEGDPEKAVEELETLVAAIDAMDLSVDQADGGKIFALTNEAQIAIHYRMFDAAESALARRAELMRQQADLVGTEVFRRGQEANIAFWNGVLATEKGDYADAEAAVEEISRLLEPDRNPRKMEPAHYLMGLIALRQGDAAAAIPHLEQAPPGNMYMKYQLAVAHELAGHPEEAQRLFREVANFNFNSVDFALVRKDALKKIQTEQTPAS